MLRNRNISFISLTFFVLQNITFSKCFLTLSSNKLQMNVETMLCWAALIGYFSLLGLGVLNKEPDGREIKDSTQPEIYEL